jgi:hypothetical protein
LGIKDINRNPPGADMDEITLEVFLKEAWVYITNFSELYIYLEHLPWCNREIIPFSWYSMH